MTLWMHYLQLTKGARFRIYCLIIKLYEHIYNFRKQCFWKCYGCFLKEWKNLQPSLMIRLVELLRTQWVFKSATWKTCIYPAKCTAELSFRTHSTSFPLSDNSDLDLMEQKCSVTVGECNACAQRLSYMDQVQIYRAQKVDEGLLYDVNVAI